MATMTASIKGFKVTCPSCGESDGTLGLDLNDLSTCTCSGCGDSFAVGTAVAKAAEVLARWEAVARWVEMAPDALGDGE